MNSGELHAWYQATGQPVHLRWRDGVITSLETTSTPPPLDEWVAAPLLDIQVNGYAGVDFQRDNLTVDDLLKAARTLRDDGCPRILLTLITDEWPRLMARLLHLRQLRAASVELQRAIAGWHVEGPFLSAEPGFHGAHNPALMCDPTPAHLREVRAITGDDPLLLTLAPERHGALAAIKLAVALGIKLSLGHTNAPADTMRAAVAAGATGFTHLGNALPQQLDRHDNVLWRVFETPGLMAGLIPDTQHVSPALFRTLHRVLAPEAIYYTTDAMAAAGALPGRYTIGTLELEVGADQIVRLPGQTNFAGSALRPIEGVFRAARMLGKSWREVWPHFSERPARLMGLTNELAPGQPATFCRLQFDPAHQLVALRTSVAGELGNGRVVGASGASPSRDGV